MSRSAMRLCCLGGVFTAQIFKTNITHRETPKHDRALHICKLILEN